MDSDSVKLYEFGYEQYEREMEALLREDADMSDITRGKVISASIDRDEGCTAKTGNKTDCSPDGVDSSVPGSETVKSAKQAYLEGKDRSRLERRMKRLEEQIATIEEDIEKRREELNAPEIASDYVKLQEIQNDIDTMEDELLDLMTQWDELSDEQL